jgi:hypothetical protein
MSAYNGRSDDELMDLARRALAAAAAAKPGTIKRAMMFAAHESVMNELKRRLVLRLNAELGLPDVDL